MQQHRSCLGTLLGAVLPVLLIFFGDNANVHWRMAQVNQELFTLAEQLGYTPDELLRHHVKMRDIAYCDATLYFTTPLDPVSFAQELHLARPELAGPGSHDYYDQLYSYLPIAVSAADAQRVQEDFRLRYMNFYRWSRPYEDQVSVTLFETSNMSITLQYNGRDIQDNIVEIYKSGGIFPLWTNCPFQTIEGPSPTD